MQLEIFPEYSRNTTLVEEQPLQFAIAEAQNPQFEVLLYANHDTVERDLHIRVNSPESNIIFSHLDPEQDINVYIDGDTVIKGNLTLTGELLVTGKISYINEENEHFVTHTIGNLNITYDINKNTVYLNNKQTSNFFEIGKRICNELKKYQEKKIYNKTRDFFNY
jgi:hypothetical protein